MKYPDKPGFWRNVEIGDILEVYELEPVNNTLCIWGPDVGITYSEAYAPNLIWTTDEWKGHIPIHRYIDINYPKDILGWELI